MNFKSGQELGHMRDFIYMNCCAKGFFTERSILEDKWLLKMTKNMRKCIFLFNEWKLEKVIEFRPPLFLQGSYFFNFFQFYLISEICVFGLKILIFEKNSFTTAVSIHKRVHLTPWIHLNASLCV